MAATHSTTRPTGSADNIVIAHGRNRTDWEVELGAVIGRATRHVSVQEAQDYLFGYMVSIDVFNRGGRSPGGYRSGSDWSVGKGHDTFAPQGPWLVPRELYGDPILQCPADAQLRWPDAAGCPSRRHDSFALGDRRVRSSVITLYPGDVINNGTSGSAVAGSAQIRSGDRYLKSGEVIGASIDGIGTLRLTTEAGEEPTGLTGAHLPPVDSHR